MSNRSCIGLLTLLFLVVGCDSPPNTTITALVQEITVKTGTGGQSYSFRFLDDQGKLWTGWVDWSSVDQEELREIIGERVTFKCFRKDLSSSNCPRPIVSLKWKGRELIKS